MPQNCSVCGLAAVALKMAAIRAGEIFFLHGRKERGGDEVAVQRVGLRCFFPQKVRDFHQINLVKARVFHAILGDNEREIFQRREWNLG